MSDDNRYIKADLADRADLSRVRYNGSGYGGPSRSDLLQMPLGLSDDEVHTVCSGGYQGTYLFIFVVDDLLWVVKDSYGSCSYCDGLLSAHDSDRYETDEDDEEKNSEHLTNYAESMMNNAYAFESKNDAVRFLHDKADDGYEGSTFAYGWSALVDEGIEALAEVDY